MRQSVVVRLLRLPAFVVSVRRPPLFARASSLRCETKGSALTATRSSRYARAFVDSTTWWHCRRRGGASIGSRLEGRRRECMPTRSEWTRPVHAPSASTPLETRSSPIEAGPSTNSGLSRSNDAIENDSLKSGGRARHKISPNGHVRTEWRAAAPETRLPAEGAGSGWHQDCPGRRSARSGKA